ncbi:hypothetical protein QYF36_011168 [Acer negundo]|nr:hypothetical protein QYF36_011168 [Acer negundo]
MPCHNILNLLSIDKSLEKQYYAADIAINKELKTLVFHYLKNKVGARHGVGAGSENIQTTAPSHMSFHISDLDFTKELEKSIFAWHAATDIWYGLDGENIKRQGPAVKFHCELICQISRYMFYLLVLHPDMVSDAGMNQIKLQSILSVARGQGPFTTRTEAHTALKEILDDTISKMASGKLNLVGYNEDFNNFLKHSLPDFFEKLKAQTLEDRWNIISLTWLEMLPYAACKCKGNHHAQQLKHVGEFLTHVWLLTVLFGFSHDEFISDPPAPVFNSVMPLLNW